MANAAQITSTWNSRYFAEIFLKPAIVTDGLFTGAGYKIDPLVNKSKTFYVGSEMKYITDKKTTCGFSPSGTSSLTEVELETQPMAINIEQCATEFFDTVFKENLNKGTDVYDLEGTVIQEYIEENYRRAMTNDSFALAWFGNASLANTAFLSPFNGWFVRFEADSEVTKSSIGSTGDFALNAMRDMYDNNPLISGDPNAEFHVTRSVYSNLLKTYENTGTDLGLTRLNNGFDLMFRGIPVIKEDVWDKVISDQGLSDSKRIIFGNLENLHVGTNIANPGSDAKAWLDDYTEKFYFKAYWDLGVTYAFGNTIAYARG